MTVDSPLLAGLAIVLFAYMIGTIPFGVVVTRWIGASDPRTKGSGNIGSTNVLRVAGKGPAAATLLLDAGKGAVAVWAASLLTADHTTRWAEISGMAVVAGHTFPVWAGFRGGKGVATGIGALAVLAPTTAGGVLLVWIAVLALFRYVSLASITAAASLPIAVFTLGPSRLRVFSVVVAAVIVIRHQENIRRLLAGTESPVGRRVR